MMRFSPSDIGHKRCILSFPGEISSTTAFVLYHNYCNRSANGSKGFGKKPVALLPADLTRLA